MDLNKVLKYLGERKNDLAKLGLAAMLSLPAFGCIDNATKNEKGNVTAQSIKLTDEEHSRFSKMSMNCRLCMTEYSTWCNENGIGKEQAIALLKQVSDHEQKRSELQGSMKTEPNQNDYFNEMIEDHDEMHSISHNLNMAVSENKLDVLIAELNEISAEIAKLDEGRRGWAGNVPKWTTKNIHDVQDAHETKRQLLLQLNAKKQVTYDKTGNTQRER